MPTYLIILATVLLVAFAGWNLMSNPGKTKKSSKSSRPPHLPKKRPKAPASKVAEKKQADQPAETLTEEEKRRKAIEALALLNPKLVSRVVKMWLKENSKGN